MSFVLEHSQTMSDGARLSDMVRVWDFPVRVFHWSLVVAFAAVWLTSEDLVALHKILGYGVLSLVGFRLMWGIVGGKYARFTNFVKSPATVLSYIRDIRAGHPVRFLGHNPAGGAMIIALLLGLTVTGVTGWMSTTDAYWGVRWVEIVHALSADGLVILVFGHVAGVILASRTHGENLIRAMLTGRKRRI